MIETKENVAESMKKTLNSYIYVNTKYPEIKLGGSCLCQEWLSGIDVISKWSISFSPLLCSFISVECQCVVAIMPEDVLVQNSTLAG